MNAIGPFELSEYLGLAIVWGALASQLESIRWDGQVERLADTFPAARQPDAENARGCTVPYVVARQDQEPDASQFHETACTWSIYCITVITVRRQGDSLG